MITRYRQRRALGEANQSAAYDKHKTVPTRGIGTVGTGDGVGARYKTSRGSYAVPNPGFPLPHIDSQKLWQQPYTQPKNAIAVALKQPYGSRYRVAGVGRSKNKIIVLQNPTGPIEPTDRGYRTIENEARLGSFQAGMNAASVVRRRRGQ